MRVPVAPFLTPPLEAISHGGWQLIGVDGESALPPELTHWDYQTVLELAAPISVDRQLVTRSCDLDAESGLAMLITAHSDHTRSEMPVAQVDVPMQDMFDLAIQLSLPGERLGGRLTLRSMLVVTEPRPRSDLAPSKPGSIVWRTAHTTLLQGIGAQFPTDASDFNQSRRHDPKAGWALEVDTTDLDARFMAAARLTMNSGHPVIELLLQGSRKDEVAQLRRTLNWDVTRQLVLLALRFDEVIYAEFDPEATSVCGVLRNLLATVWPGDSPVTVRGWWETDPTRVELRLQSHCGLVG
jgi:hypothetical protein